MPLRDGVSPITEAIEFDIAVFGGDTSRGAITGCKLYNSADSPEEDGDQPVVGYLHQATDVFRRRILDDESPEFSVVADRIAAGECAIRYGSRYPGITTEEMTHNHWELIVENPFEPIYRFFEHLAEGGKFTKGDPNVFEFPGIVKQAPAPGKNTIWLHKRAASHPPVPNVPYDGDEDAMIAGFADAGWTRQLPSGFQTLYAFTQEYGTMTDGSPWWDPGPVLAETGVQLSWENRVRQLAAVYREWDASHTGTGTASLNAYVWWRSWIGYAWELVHDDSITSLRVHRRSGARREQVAINGRENVLRWAINHLVNWAAQGIDAWLTSHDTSIVSSTLSEPSLGHVESDGTVGDIRVGAVDEADWVRYQGPSYREAGGSCPR